MNGGDRDDKTLFDDAISEIREIVNGSVLEKICEKSKKKAFNIDIIKTDEEVEIEHCYSLNQYFLNKKFKPIEDEDGYWVSKCENYFDKIDIIVDHNRCEIIFNLDKKELNQVFKIWKETYNEFEYPWFKYYWNNTKQPIYLYKNSNYDWDSLMESERIENYKDCFEEIIKKYRLITGK